MSKTKHFVEPEDDELEIMMATPIKAEKAREYPRWIFHPDYEAVIVNSAEDEAEFEGCYASPADYGVITCPSASQLRLQPKIKE